MKFLVVTADDFGIATEVNEAVEQAYRDGVLTAASLMVGAPGAADAVARARKLENLRVGLHIVLVEGKPLLPRSEIPDLTDRNGNFRTDMVTVAFSIFFRTQVRQQLAAEIRAQFEAFRATGLKLDHVNTHKHFHLHPTIADTILKIGRDYGLDAMRVPVEPRNVIRQMEPNTAAWADGLTAYWARRARSAVRRSGVTVPDAVFGLAWSGKMTTQRVRGFIENLPDGLSEIYLHPAISDRFAGSADGYCYREELSALLDPRIKEALGRYGVVTGGFSDFRDGEISARI